MARPWPLTGRDDEVRRVARATRAGAPGIVVAGPAGVGKTRLAHEAAALAAAHGGNGRGADVVWAHGSTAARVIPLGAFAGVLEMPPGDAADTITRALDQLAARQRLLLVVDDAHLLDEHSALVVHRVVVRRLAPVVVTLRSGEPAPDTVTALWKDDHLPRLDLSPLALDETTSLVARVLQGPVDTSSARRLWTLTQGSPLFLRHLLAGEVSAGRFSAGSGVWRWTGDPTLSSPLTGLLEREMGDLPAGVRDVVDLVSLAEPVLVQALATLTSIDDVEEAERRGLVRTDTVVARLAHPLYGEVRRAAMGSVRARRLRGRVAQTLTSEPDPIPRAVLTVDSDLPADPVLFLRAAEAALALYDLPLAEKLAGAAAASGDPRALLVHASVLSWLSRGEEAEDILLGLAAAAPDETTRALVHLHRAGNLLWTLARPDEAHRAVAAARATGAAPVHVTSMELALAAAEGDLATVLEAGPPLLRSGPPDELAGILASSAVSAAAAVSGESDLLDEAAAAGRLSPGQAPAVIPGFGLADLQVLGHRLAGTADQVEPLLRRLLAASADLPGPARLMGRVVAGHAALAHGLVAEALVPLREAWAGLATSTHEFRFRCRTLLLMALGQAGETAQAADLASRFIVAEHPAWRLHAPDDLLALAWAAAAQGAVTEALRHAVGAARLAREAGARAQEVLAWQTAVQFGDAAEALAALQPVADLSPRAAVACAHARAWAGRDAAALLEVADRWTRLGDLVAAGDAAAQAADLHHAHGRQGAALTAATLAGKLADRSGARTPALAVASLPLPLTAREREIAVLAARGLSNRAIAERLTLSVRTVEGHLYRACLKLGLSERTGLGALLGVE